MSSDRTTLVAPGIRAERAGENVRITARAAPDKSILLTVTPEYARALAAELFTASMTDEERSNEQTRAALRKLAKQFAPLSLFEDLFRALGGKR